MKNAWEKFQWICVIFFVSIGAHELLVRFIFNDPTYYWMNWK